MAKNKGISVVICSYNSEHRIKHVLDCLSSQQDCENLNWEVIMVDNASTDNVVEVAKQSWNHPVVPLRILHESRQGQSYATRTGIENAAFHIIVMVDDDNYLSPKYIRRAYEIMENHSDVGIAGGKGTGFFEEKPPSWFGMVEQAYAIGPQGEQEGYVGSERGYIYGAGSIIRKSVYNYLITHNFKLIMRGRIGKSLIAGEDAERCQVFRILGYKLWYDPLLEFEHHMPARRISWSYTCRLFNSFGRASNYHDLYREILDKPGKFKTFIMRNAIADMLNKLRKYLEYLPAYFLVRFTGSGEGKVAVLNYNFWYGRLVEGLVNRRKIIEYRQRIKHAEWRKEYANADIPEE